MKQYFKRVLAASGWFGVLCLLIAFGQVVKGHPDIIWLDQLYTAFLIIFLFLIAVFGGSRTQYYSKY